MYVVTTLASGVTYYPFGPMKDYTLGNSILRAATYDQSYRIDTLTHGSLFGRDYAPDAYDNFTAIDDQTLDDKDQALTYDDLDRLDTATGANTYGSIDFGTYDLVGNREKVNLNAGQDDVYGYSATSNRLDTITGPNPQSFTYDPAGNMLTRGNYTHTYNAKNRMETSTLGSVSTTYIHNAFGERAQKVETAKTTHYLYHGPQLLFEYDSTQSKEYVYLNDQPLAVFHGSSLATAATLTYKPTSGSQDGEEKLSNGNVNRTEDTLDMAQESSNPMLVAIRYRDVAIPPAATILEANIQFKADGSNSGSVALDIQAEDAGNAPSIQETSANLSSRTKTQANVSWSPNPWTLNDRGPDQLTPEIKSVIQEVVDRPDWNSGNNLMILVSGSGKRKAKSYDASANQSPKLTIEYLLPGSQPEEVFYFHNDHLGTPQAMTDASGSVVWQADYKPFGEANVHTETIVNNLRFPGQYYDAESGLHYNYFRDYDPGIGRYVESDPIGLAGGINTYAYVGNNPLYWIDPLGLAAAVPIPAPVVIPGFRLPTPNPWWMLIYPKPAGEGSDIVPPGPYYNDKSRQSKPDGCPTGTVPIDQAKGKFKWDKDDVHGIKDQIGAGPKDWTGVSPDGHIWTGDGSGNGVDNGHWTDLIR